MAPGEWTAQFTSILVPVDGSGAGLQAVAIASDIAHRNKGKVYVIHVIEVKRALPLDAELELEATAGEEMLRLAEQTAHQENMPVDTEILQAREAGHAIVDEAIERGANLIILGVEYAPPFGEFVPGRVMTHVLKNAPCEVWVVRRPVQE